MKTNYFDTLAAGLDEVAAHCQRECALAPSDCALNIRDLLSNAFSGGLNYGETVSKNVELGTLRGKGTRKHLQVTIHRFGLGNHALTGRYEIVAYFL